jgi:hypothetical protein
LSSLGFQDTEDWVVPPRRRLALNHREVPIKVTAWIDEGVVPLVEALNTYPQVVTVASCEGHDDDHGAYVLFNCEGQDPAEFASELGRALSDERVGYLLRAEWRPGNEVALLELACPRDEVGDLAAAVSACRTRLSPGGTARTAPRS